MPSHSEIALTNNMHILLTNDDGPPNPTSSPYVLDFVKVLRSPPFNHTVSVVLPTTQRSWIGKAHLLPPSVKPVGIRGLNDTVADLIQPTYYDPRNATTNRTAQELLDGRGIYESEDRDDYYVLIPGTPATCIQLGLFHHQQLFPDRKSTPVDLVLSGPNYGRNTTAAFALSSGTIGGALEAAICGFKAMALSFAFFTRQEPPAVVREACTLAARISEKLYNDWTDKADLYTVNVPLVEGVSERPVRWTWMLSNKWENGCLYQLVEDAEEDPRPKAGRTAEDVIKAEAGSAPDTTPDTTRAPSFRWSPQFASVWSTVENSDEGNDGRVIRDQLSSVTALKANFEGVYGAAGFKGDLKL